MLWKGFTVITLLSPNLEKKETLEERGRELPKKIKKEALQKESKEALEKKGRKEEGNSEKRRRH